MVLIRLAIRNARRNVQRTALTAATVVLGTAILTVALSWMDGVFGTITDVVADFGGHVRVMTPGYGDREELMPLYDHLQGVPALVQAAGGVAGVAGAYPRIVMPVTLSVGDTIGEHFGLAVGAPIAWYRDALGLDDVLVEGRSLEAATGEVVLGRAVASALQAQLGDEVLVLGQTQDGALSPIQARLVGVVSAGTQAVDRGVFLPLEQVQWLADLEGDATELLIYGDDKSRGPALATALSRLPAFDGLVVQAWDAAPLSSAIVAVGRVLQGAIGAIIVVVCALGVWNTMMMSVLERTAEIGVLRAMGLSRAGAVLLFVVEGLVIAAVGGALGVAMGAVVAGWLQVHGIALGERLAMNTAVPVQARMYAALSWGVVGRSFGLGLVTALVGTAVPAWQAATIQPVDAMRTRH